MKPLIFAFLLLLVMLLVVYWMNGRFGNTMVSKTTAVSEKMLYFEPEIVLEVGKQAEISLMGNYSGAVITGFNIDFTYDSTMVKIEEISIDGNFNKGIESNVDQNFGKVSIKAGSGFAFGSLRSGIQKLVTIKMTGLKKGGMIITNVRRPEVTIWENGKNVEGNFTMRAFKVGVK